MRESCYQDTPGKVCEDQGLGEEKQYGCTAEDSCVGTKNVGRLVVPLPVNKGTNVNGYPGDSPEEERDMLVHIDLIIECHYF